MVVSQFLRRWRQSIATALQQAPLIIPMVAGRFCEAGDTINLTMACREFNNVEMHRLRNRQVCQLEAAMCAQYTAVRNTMDTFTAQLGQVAGRHNNTEVLVQFIYAGVTNPGMPVHAARASVMELVAASFLGHAEIGEVWATGMELNTARLDVLRRLRGLQAVDRRDAAHLRAQLAALERQAAFLRNRIVNVGVFLRAQHDP